MALRDRLPSRETLERNRFKISGFAGGVVFAVLTGMLGGVLYTGDSAFYTPKPDATPIYPNF